MGRRSNKRLPRLEAADVLEAIRNGVADGIMRIMKQPGIVPADFLQAIEEGTARGVASIAEEKTSIEIGSDVGTPAVPPKDETSGQKKRRR